MAQIQPPETFDFSTPNEWPKWRKRFERYLVVSGMKKKEEADKIDLLMFEKEEEATKIDSVLKAFDSHFCVRKNIIYERAKFNSRIQEDREPVDEFITSLYKLADSCKFESLHEQLIRDRIVVGVRDRALSEIMQLDSELTLKKAVKMVRQQEAVRQQQVDLQRPSTSQKVNQVKFNSKKQSPKQQQQPSRKEKSAKTRTRCPKCGGFTHREGQACRAEGQRCNLFSKTGHFGNCCPDKQAKTAEVKAVSELDEEIGECRRRWTAEIQVNGKQVKFKLDSQADVTCVPMCLFKKIMGQQRLVESDINIRAAEFSELQTVGTFISTLRNGNYEIKEKIYVIRRLSEPLLSRRACELLILARRIEVVATRINPIREFPEVFERLGQIGNPYEIKLKPGAKPYAVHTPRRVPIPLMEKLKTRLEELERAGIIAQVNVATEWCAPTVITGKSNGDIRLCVDLSRLNEHVQCEGHPMPVVEHMLGQLGEERLFSKLDANSGFHQIPLCPDCQHLTTFITPFGKYKICRMPFGISLAPEYFQRVMSIILQGMDGVMCYLDDILLFASDSKTHDRILRLVLRKLKEAKVTLNKAKCVIGVPRINFLGHFWMKTVFDQIQRKSKQWRRCLLRPMFMASRLRLGLQPGESIPKVERIVHDSTHLGSIRRQETNYGVIRRIFIRLGSGTEAKRNKLARSLQKPLPLPSSSNSHLKILKRLKNTRSLVITKSDMGSNTVILNQQDYHSKMLILLQDTDTFLPITPQERNFILNKFKTSLSRLKRSSSISPEHHRSFISNLSSSTYIYGLPKVHKPGIPLRPITSYHLSPAYPLSKYLFYFLYPLLGSKRSCYSVADTPSFVSEVIALQPTPHHVMCSYDVTSLYLSLPHSLIMESINLFLTTVNLDPPTISTITQLVSICQDMGTFTYKQDYYKQIRGSPMGSPLSSIAAEIVMIRIDTWINQVHHSDNQLGVVTWTTFYGFVMPAGKNTILSSLNSTIRTFISVLRTLDVSHVTRRSVTGSARTPNEWPIWRKRFERYLVVSGMKKKEEAAKIDLFMYLMGDHEDDIFRTFKFEKEEEATEIDSVLKAFDSHFCVRKNIIYERAKFNSRIQEDREPVDEFITSLYKLADSCEFEGLHEQLIPDRIVVGVRDKALSERMQLDSELTLEKAVKLIRQQEAVRQQQIDLQRPSTSQKVHQVKFNSKKQSPIQQQKPLRKKEKSAKTRSRCPKCGGFTHREGQACRVEGQRFKAVSELDEEIDFLLQVSAVEDSSNLDDDEGECRRRWTAEIQVNGKQVKFKLDSQADVTCVPLCLFKKIMGKQRLVESDINIRAAEFSELQTVGMFISTLRNVNFEIKEKIYVIRRLSEPLLSRRACELLNLARRIEVVATRINPIEEFPEVFERLGQIGNPYEIKLKPGAKPYAVHTPRRVPIPLMEKLKTRLEELEKAGIIAQVNVATEWCAPTVIAGKLNGDIRLCVDLSRLNEHVQRAVHPMPVVDHMLGQRGEARFFLKLDANSGFHQIPLSPDCQHLTTFITPFGRYKYCRMPFGISLAPEYFQKVMSIILQGMDGVMCYLDDIPIFASDSKTHDRIFRLVLRKLKEAKVTLNKAKCVFGVPIINFLGHILDEDGVRPDSWPDVHGLRRFLGMVNHLGRFVENISEIVAPLNQLLVKGQDFVWDCSQERAFRKLEELLTTQPTLAAYDVRKPTMVSSDASSYGLGAVLKQKGKNGIWRPVAYSSRTMTPTEKRYAQIEKEALAITWACERFQDFLLGKRFPIEIDPKTLIPLFSTKELSSLTPRLQRFRMRMMRFGFEIVHIPGKELLDADALSRQPILTTKGGENERPTSAHINAVLSCITDKDEMLTKIFEAQQKDTTLKAVVNYLEQGWPNKKKICRLVIPASMKLEILDKLHAGLFGITKTRLRALETVWWPGISEEIAETVRKCSVCIQEAVSKHEPLIPTNFPTRPWQKIGIDLLKFENKWYLVVIDYYSRFPEMIQVDRLTAHVVVRSFKSIFARHGIPETVVSDNGTQFGAAREFANFAMQYGFTLVTSSPRFPQSNGMAEAGVKIAKLILKKNQDPSLGLREYRSSPLKNGYSPAELLMGRKLRTTLPIAPENLNPRLVDSQTLKRKEGRRRKDMKSRYDRHCGATDMEEQSKGDTVWITDMRTWGIVKQKASTPRSYMVDTPVGTLRRNRFHLRKGDTVQYPTDPSTPTFSGEELVENEKTPVVDYPSNDSEDGQIRTWSERIVKPSRELRASGRPLEYTVRASVVRHSSGRDMAESMVVEGVLPWRGDRSWADLVLREVCGRFISVVGDHFFRSTVQELAEAEGESSKRSGYS
ncbi:K02A2.6-like [Cordylochernes scorpioides]|uniref:RNA-directed DNA polymerase n=1 Tax=Cordylochernes scorpioides TaxID=51811 RepID=A0ABY6L7A5_9ARAC|nr:K02A2.6-like [Cordylochernes scorpioides]